MPRGGQIESKGGFSNCSLVFHFFDRPNILERKEGFLISGAVMDVGTSFIGHASCGIQSKSASGFSIIRLFPVRLCFIA